MSFSVGVDIGGSHVTAGIVDLSSNKLLEHTLSRYAVDSHASISTVINSWCAAIKQSIKLSENLIIEGIGFAMPGPFDYFDGISGIYGVGKYELLFGLDVRHAIAKEFPQLPVSKIRFMNDAHCFLIGENNFPNQNVIGLTLGTGFGSAFMQNRKIICDGESVPQGGFLYNQPLFDARAEDYFNNNWFLKRFSELTGKSFPNVKAIVESLEYEKEAKLLFSEFTQNLSDFISPYIIKFNAKKLIIGGNISRAHQLFLKNLQKELPDVEVIISALGENAALFGAANICNDDFYFSQYQRFDELSISYLTENTWRKTEQYLIPNRKAETALDNYDIYPAFDLGKDKIICGVEILVDELSKHKTIIIDGYVGVFWKHLADQLHIEFSKRNISISIFDVAVAMKDEAEIDSLIKPFLGKEDSIFGSRTNLHLKDFFVQEKIISIKQSENSDINILLGCGASLSNWEGFLVYADLPKNELQFRMRAESIYNLGSSISFSKEKMYKRFYFVDWIVLNEHKKNILPKINLFVDAQRANELTFANADDIRNALKAISKSFFRVRPWFEPGPWGGSWIKNKIEGVALNVPNYAWSFELIVPENGLLFESNNSLLEISFDFLMYQESRSVLGDAEERFRYEFPIRFDFLDTFDGGNLSVQCHPRPEYIKNEFGENFTQDESYYILDTKNNAKVYLGFQKDIQPEIFKKDLEASHKNSSEVEIDKYVQTHQVEKHDLLLIPNGTIHGSGKDNLVLEISSTPYIFTFKMYDWLRMDLKGNPRPINIDHAFNNLYFDRNGEKVKEEFIAKPIIISSGGDWKIVHLKTHEQQFYDVHRYEFTNSINIDCENKFYVCMLVEGEAIILETENGRKQKFNYAETFVISAAAKSFTLHNTSNKEVKIVSAFIK